MQNLRDASITQSIMFEVSVIITVQEKRNAEDCSERTWEKKVINLLHLNLLYVCVCASTADIIVCARDYFAALIFPTVFYWISIINYNFKR